MLVQKLFYSTPHQHRLDVQPAGKELFFKAGFFFYFEKTKQLQDQSHSASCTAKILTWGGRLRTVLQHLLCHKVLIRDRRLMPTQIGGIPVPCSERWLGRMESISLQKPSTLSVHFWIPVLRVAVAFQQCTGSWPALCTLWIATREESEEAGWFITDFY